MLTVHAIILLLHATIAVVHAIEEGGDVSRLDPVLLACL